MNLRLFAKVVLVELKFTNMRVIIPVTESFSIESDIAKGFIEAEFACIYDSEKESYEWYTPAEIAEEPGNFTLGLKQKGVSGVISTHMPFMALGLFKDSGLDVYKAKGTKLADNIQYFINNELAPFTGQESRTASSCAGSCSSCDTSSSCN